MMNTTTPCDLFPELNTLTFYRSLLDEPLIKDLMILKTLTYSNDKSVFEKTSLLEVYYRLKAFLLDEGLTDEAPRHYHPTLWKDAVLRLVITRENTLTRQFEKECVSLSHPLIQSMLQEFKTLLALYHFNWSHWLLKAGIDSDPVFDCCLYTPTPEAHEVVEAFESGKIIASFQAVNHYIYTHGLGIFEMNQSFKVLKNGQLCPLHTQHYKAMDTLVGCEREKQELIANTAALIHDHTGLNVLLQGDMGTGKSTMVKALLNYFKDTRLKMIEFKKDQLAEMPEVVAQIKKRPYPFILFIDDLSFEENDQDYKLFKNILEGSLEENPDHIRIYATSNKRHLVTETLSERDNAVHTRDVMEEKLSLSSRFGLVLTFSAPDQKTYLNIVSELAHEAGIDLPEETLHARARQWAMRHLNRSGRTAEQFIEYLKVNGHRHETP